jgi:hypothetical protein
MTTTTTQSADAAACLSAEPPEATAEYLPTLPETPRDQTLDASSDDGIDELEKLLAKFDSPELVSIRHLFNMC